MESPHGPPYAPITMTADDLGSWDVELTGRTPLGAPVTARGIETNTLGCNGGCIVTRVEGALVQATARLAGSESVWWMGYGQPNYSDLVSSGLPQMSVVSSGPVPRPGSRDGTPPPGVRMRVEYVDAKRRVVTVYDATGDTARTRIVYTRRQP